MIFEEHAILEWRAPTIDGQACRFWREVVFNTPRAWAYLRFRPDHQPSTGELRLRLLRSGAAPLHIDFHKVGNAYSDKLYDLFSDNHTRIVSLRTYYGSKSFFKGQDFPCMRHLRLSRWYPVQWGSMPKLQSLRLCGASSSIIPPDLPSLSRTEFTSVLRHSQSLTTLTLSYVSLVDTISGPVTLPSLTYLSLHCVTALKPHINAPCLVTYHEVGGTVDESFNIPLPSPMEYGMAPPPARSPDPAEWHRSFPNILKLSLHADQLVVISILTFLANQPRSFLHCERYA